MKKIVYSLAILALAACAKEVQKEEVVPQDGNTVTTIIANVNPGTRTTLDIVGNVGEYSWEENETISVFNGEEALSFSVVNQENGTFQYTGQESTENLSYAVSPAGALISTSDGYKLTLKENYTGYKANVSNAVMVAGEPTVEGDYKKFTFDHAAALMRFTFENVPAGTSKLEFFSSGKAINGTYDININEPELTRDDANGSNSTSLELAAATTDDYSDLVFYVPIPTGNYTDFTVTLYKGTEVVVTKTMTMKSGTKLFTAAKGDIVNTPVITLDKVSSAKYVKVTSDNDLGNGTYLIVYETGKLAMNGAGTTPSELDDPVDIDFNSNGEIDASDDIDDISFTIATVTGGGFSILSAGGKYIGGANKGITADDNAITNSISIDSGNATISSNNYTLFYNGNNTSVFRFYSSTQQSIQLYKRQNGGTSHQLSTPQGLSVNAATKTVSWYAVSNATSYELTVGDEDYSENVSISGNKVSAAIEIDDECYDVAVIAKAEGYLDSTPATLTKAKFGNPTLVAPIFTNTVTVTDNSIEVSWGAVTHATKYHCSISPAPASPAVSSKVVTTTSVKFEGLTKGETYSITIYAIDGEGKYANSETATKSGIKAEEPAGASPNANGVCFSITSYSALPQGWTCTDGVSIAGGNSPYILITKGNSMTSPAYNISGYSSATVSVKLATYGSGTNPTATLAVSYDGGTTWTESTTGTPTSKSYITTSLTLSKTFTKNVVVKLSLPSATSGQDLRVQDFTFTVTE